MKRISVVLAMVILMLAGCGEEDTKAVRGGGTTQPATAPCDACTDHDATSKPSRELPAGHPPLPMGGKSSGMPAGHGMQSMGGGAHGMMGQKKPAAPVKIPFKAPSDWTTKAPRGMTAADGKSIALSPR